MWSDQQIAEAFDAVQTLERAARQELTTPDLAERDAALVCVRHFTAARKALESWMATRQVRAHVRMKSIA